MHCSQVWRPLLVKDFQCCATIFILNNYVSDYRTRLLKLHILPLSMLYELNDMFFFFFAVVVVVVKSLKQASSSFTITDYVSFTNNNTRSGSHHKLVQPIATTKHFYYNRLPHLWNSLPPIDISMKASSLESRALFWDHFMTHPILVPYHFCCPCTNNVRFLPNQLSKLILHASYDHLFSVAMQPSYH